MEVSAVPQPASRAHGIQVLLSYLSRVPELGGHGSAHCHVDISAVEHDEGGVASQLHGRLLHSVSGQFQQHLRGNHDFKLGQD